MAKCVFLKSDGERCGQRANLNNEGLCFWHDPARTLEAKRARQRGGVAAGNRRSKPVRVASEAQAPEPPETAQDAAQWASWAIRCVATGKLDAKTAREIGQLVRAFLKAHHAAEMETRVGELEAKIKALEGKRAS